MTLLLDTSPDTYGWLFGRWIAPDGERVSVLVMPPLDHWNGSAVLDGNEPHPTDWVVFVEGQEVARVDKRVSIDTALRQVFSSTQSPGSCGS